jgi:hypothetical protein
VLKSSVVLKYKRSGKGDAFLKNGNVPNVSSHTSFG